MSQTYRSTWGLAEVGEAAGHVLGTRAKLYSEGEGVGLDSDLWKADEDGLGEGKNRLADENR